MNNFTPIIRQRTAEWYTARLGKFTASNFSNLMAKPSTNSEWSKTAISYIEDLALQLYLTKYTQRQNNDAMRWGMRHEEMALKEFSDATGFAIKDPGFILHPRFTDVGATPDAVVVGNVLAVSIILAQVKCPFSEKIHQKYARKICDAASLKKCRSAIHWQMQGEMWVSGASYSYFVSYNPRVLGNGRLHFARIDRDEKAIVQLENVIPKAISLRDHFLERYRKG